jgi:flagellar hook-length control protein FliK
MMGSAMALLTGVAPATTAATTQGDSAAQGTDFLGALLAAAPVLPADPAAESLLPAAPAADAAPTDAETAAELAALIAALLPVAAAADAIPAETAEAVEAGLQPAAAAATPAKALEQLLQRLAQEAGSAAEQAQAPVAPAATGAVAAKLPPDSGLHQLLQAMTPRSAQPAPPATMPKPGTGKGSDVSQAFAASLASADAALRAPELAARPVMDVQPTSFTSPTTELQAAVPAQSQSPSPSPGQLQPQATALTQPQPQAATATATHTVHNRVGSPRWADELGSRMMLMTVSGHHEGSLNLTPEHLGPLEVRVSVNQGTTNVWFGAQHADTRAALAEALPRLRELFADAGLVLGHAGVSQEAPRQDARSGAAERFTAATPDGASEDVEAAAPVARRIALGLVDTYA